MSVYNLLEDLHWLEKHVPAPNVRLALGQAIKEIARLTERCDAYKEALSKEIRINELLASAMRNPERTGGWEGAERVARAFDRAADRAKAALAQDKTT